MASIPKNTKIVGVILALLLALGTGVAFAQGGTTEPATDAPAATPTDDATAIDDASSEGSDDKSLEGADDNSEDGASDDDSSA
jgi:hypothetical protein